MSLTTEQRYKPYAEWTEEEIKKIKENAASSPWHTNFHIEPPYGLLNDPNGFSFSRGNGSSFTNISHLVQPMVSNPGYKQSLQTWCISKKPVQF